MTKTTETYGPCWSCGGSGKITHTELTSGYLPCSRCGGSGQIVTSRTTETTHAGPSLKTRCGVCGQEHGWEYPCGGTPTFNQDRTP